MAGPAKKIITPAKITIRKARPPLISI